MIYSTFVKQLLMASIDELSQTPEDYTIHLNKEFTRNRKIEFHDFLLLLLTIEIVPEIYKNLIAPLSNIEFDMDELKELYHLWWAQKTAHCNLK